MMKAIDGCCGNIEVPTEKERDALAMLKSLKEQVRDIKKRIASLSDAGYDNGSPKLKDLNEELERLKSLWNTWEQRRLLAREERMILLGHAD